MNDYNWWQRAVIYEVYVRSFRDSDGDGVGDLPGVIEKLPYLQDLGVDAIWLTPFYKSPMVDNGYDVSDYDHVDPLFGTDEDFGRLVAEAHARGMKVVIDIVVNHTSSEHPWFRESRSSKDSPKRDWYLWTSAPNEWRAVFGGPAWNYDETTGEYYLGLFSKAQPDLNWNNPEVRAEVKAMMRRWAARGVDGFRLDVISLIAKPDGLLNGTLENADLSASGDWHSLIANRDETHSFIHELHRDVFAPCGLMTVGETSAVTLAEALRYSGRTRE
ncbi:MAG: glucohydrolase, partial [Clostridia bacterium]|nr:glucohydrolase [Clostridia bacterium]